MLFRVMKNSLISAILLAGAAIIFLFIIFWLFGESFFKEPIKDSFFNIIKNFTNLIVIFFIVLGYIISRVILEVKEEKATEQFNKQSPNDVQAQKALKNKWFVYKIAIFIVFLFILIYIFGFSFVLQPLYKMGM